MLFNYTLLGKLFPIWLSVQTDLAKVFRWDIYFKADKLLRKQSSLHHQYSVCVAILPGLFLLKEHKPDLDTELIKDAFILHDIPEGLLKMKVDVINSEKRQSHDINEHSVFHKHFSHFDDKLFHHMHRAYLLQFAHKPLGQLNMFLPKTLEMIDELRRTRKYECDLFRALECWEYLFYAYEAYLATGNKFLIVNVLRPQVPQLQQYATDLMGFREVFFPPHMEEACLKFIEENSSIGLPVRPAKKAKKKIKKTT